MKFQDVIEAVTEERASQIRKHNLTRWHDLEYDPDWFLVLAEEFGEVAREIENIRFERPNASTEQLRHELVQVITVASAWLSDEE